MRATGLRLGLFDDPPQPAAAVAPDRCGPALLALAESVDRYLLGDSLSEDGLGAARHQMVASLEMAWKVLRPMHRVRNPPGGTRR